MSWMKVWQGILIRRDKELWYSGINSDKLIKRWQYNALFSFNTVRSTEKVFLL